MGATWAARFLELEVSHGLDIHNTSHLWLLHYLFLPILNHQLHFFAQAWNQHRIEIRGGPNRSPADMFGFDMYVHGVRGSQLPNEENLSPDDMEVYGVDWEGLQDDHLLRARSSNNPDSEEATSWIQGGPPPRERMNEIVVEPPTELLSVDELDYINRHVPVVIEELSEGEISRMWRAGLIAARSLRSDIF